MGFMHINNLYKDQRVLFFKRLFAMEKVHGCLKKGTMVTTADGRDVPIEKLSVGQIVVSFDEVGKKFVHNKVLSVLIQPRVESLPWFRIRLGNGRELICTADHPLLTEKGWVRADSLSVHDNLVEMIKQK